ncbi:MAG: ABC transporter ATP-binding protein [Caldilineales bacterium]|nr:ABC transporter ATP-binding protein [Caldilineales bacterium]MDW8316709.1 ABC transporter ATP-binding protein [Anaerolineae bacterium]
MADLSDGAAALSPRLVVDVQKRLPGLDLRVRLEVGSEILVLFGPSGAGKTTTLNMIAGLVAPDVGSIALDGRLLWRKGGPGRDVAVPSRQRRVGYVFQHYALFPHLTALENVAYPLQAARQGRKARAQAMALLEQMHLGHLADRYPHQLSGGQQQRVAIARALAANPAVLLLDEPFSALDVALRERLQEELRALQRERALPVIYVTHRLEDALAIADRLAVLADGQVQQSGPIAQVVAQPVNGRVAQVMGLRNLFQAQVVAVTPEHTLLDWGGATIAAPPQPVAVGEGVTVYVPPEAVKILYPGRPVPGFLRQNAMKGVLLSTVEHRGRRQWRVLLENGYEVELQAPSRAYVGLGLAVADPVQVSFWKDAVVVLRPAGGAG